MKSQFMKTLFAVPFVLYLGALPLMASALELTPQQMANISLDTAVVSEREAVATLSVNGILRADQKRLFRVSPVVDGLVTELKVVAQRKVRKGDVLARLRSNTLGQAQTDYLEALVRNDVARADYLRVKGLSDEGVVATSRLLAVESEYKMADAMLDQRYRELTLAGMNKAQIKELARNPDNIAGYTLSSPVSGVLLEVSVENGQMLTAGQSAFRIADLSVVWAVVQIPVANIGNVALGSQASIRVAAYPQQRFTGQLESLSGEVDVSSQTLSGRVVIDNRHGRLRPGMYAQAALQSSARTGLMVPASALFRRGNASYVFIVRGARSFEPVKVISGKPVGGWVGIESGVRANDIVVSSGVAELKSHWQYQGGE